MPRGRGTEHREMLLARYFLYVGGALLALLLIVSAMVPQAPVAPSTNTAGDLPAIRINSDRKWPAKVVFDTSAPTIVPPQLASNALELRRQQPVALFYRSLDVRVVAASVSARGLRVVHSAGGESTLRFMASACVGRKCQRNQTCRRERGSLADRCSRPHRDAPIFSDLLHGVMISRSAAVSKGQSCRLGLPMWNGTTNLSCLASPSRLAVALKTGPLPQNRPGLRSRP
jgi:hypothetical protein